MELVLMKGLGQRQTAPIDEPIPAEELVRAARLEIAEAICLDVRRAAVARTLTAESFQQACQELRCILATDGFALERYLRRATYLALASPHRAGLG